MVINTINFFGGYRAYPPDPRSSCVFFSKMRMTSANITARLCKIRPLNSIPDYVEEIVEWTRGPCLLLQQLPQEAAGPLPPQEYSFSKNSQTARIAYI